MIKYQSSLIFTPIKDHLSSFLGSHLNTIRLNHRVTVLSVVLSSLSLRIVLIILYVWLAKDRATWDNWIIECIVSTSVSQLVSEVAEHDQHKEGKEYSTAYQRSTSNNYCITSSVINRLYWAIIAFSAILIAISAAVSVAIDALITFWGIIPRATVVIFYLAFCKGVDNI